MSFLGRPSPPFVIWALIFVLSHMIANPFAESGKETLAWLIYGTGFFLIGLTYYLWRFKDINF